MPYLEPDQLHRVSDRRPVAQALGPAERLAEAQASERAGEVGRAVRLYHGAIQAATASGTNGVLGDALRALSILHHRRNEPETARALCRRSHDLGVRVGDQRLVARALNTLAGFAFETGAMLEARRLFTEALAVAASLPEIAARVEHNLGMLDAVQGDLDSAILHYQRSLAAHEGAGDEHGQALAHHNLAVISMDRRLWAEVDRHLEQSLALAERVRDPYLVALGLLTRGETSAARGRYGLAREATEQALERFHRLESELEKADAYRILGVVYRESGRPELAEARLQDAVTKARETGGLLCEAEALRELAILFQLQNRNHEALTRLNACYQLFGRLNAQGHLRDIAAKRNDLEGTFVTVVRDWGQSIESADAYTHGHCERVATYAAGVARALGLEPDDLRTIRLGAYLHDLGKVRVPHEILNKPGALTPEEFEVVKTHPVWGAEMLAEIEFPWELLPIIRWHHERYSGAGYPDQLAGDAIPLHAQIVGIADVYDALTTVRPYRRALSPAEAHKIIVSSPEFWAPRVLTAFLRALEEDFSSLDPIPDAAVSVPEGVGP